MSRWSEEKVEENAALGLLGEDFQHARPLWNAEVHIILQHHIKSLQSNEAQGSMADGGLGLGLAAANATSTDSANQMLMETMKYVERLNNYPSKEAIDAAHAQLLNVPQLTEWEVALVNNLRIDEVDECLTLIPTIREKVDRGELDADSVLNVLNELNRYQKGAS